MQTELIKYKEAGKFEDTRFEKIHNVIFESSQEASIIVAQEIATLIKEKQAANQPCVLGLATGSSPIKVYEELVRMHKEDGLSFSNVVSFNLDEYYPMDRSNIQSYYYFMHEHLFNHVDILPENVNVPNGTVSSADLHQYCIDYENKIKGLGGLDEGASAELTRVKTPWLVAACDWNDELVLKSVAWLCEQTNKPFLKLTDKDYNDNGMSDLLVEEGSAYDLNIKMFNKMQKTITGWPGGKPNADDSNRPERATPEKKRVIIFSPHPDDDVISMGGTFDRLVQQGHDVHIAYQTSGNIAVSDDEALKFAEIIKTYNAEDDELSAIIDYLSNKTGDAIDSLEVRKLKARIRRGESLGATRYLGVADSNVHFLDLPFYETGTIKKNNLSQADIDIVSNLITEVKPHQIYAAGDLADPHGTHKVCLDAIFASLKELKHNDFMDDCWVWLYRGAWHEWESYEIEMAVPMSPDQVLRKRHAIFCHQSQKDGVMFQGDDNREFWVRAEDRNRLTAKKYNDLGLADYAAIEAFKRYFF